MSLVLQQRRTRLACARLHEALVEARECLPLGERLTFTLVLAQITSAVNRGPVLALPWTPEPPRPDAKMRAANDRSLQS